MKKTALISILVIMVSLSGRAQPSWRVSHGVNLTADKVKMLCKTWKLDSVEMFDVAHTANAKEKGDCVTFNTDGSFLITTEGVSGSGTWKAAGVYLNTVSKSSGATTETKMLFKAISIEANKLVLDYQTPDLITVRYTYLLKE